MLRILAPFFVVGFIVSGCALFSTGLTPEEEAALTPLDKANALVTSVGVVVDIVRNYVEQPRCVGGQTIACSDPEVVATIKTLLRPVRDALVTLQATIGAGLNPVEGAATLRRLLATLEQELIRRGIAGGA